jgi:hypothetical protein
MQMNALGEFALLGIVPAGSVQDEHHPVIEPSPGSLCRLLKNRLQARLLTLSCSHQWLFLVSGCTKAET